jgi:hypothetical protein
MRAWIIRFASLYVFDVVVLLLIDVLVPGVRVGFAALWAAVILTAATIWLKPLVHRWFRSMAAGGAARRSKIGEKLVQYLLVLAVAAIIWVLVVVFTGVNVRGFVFGWFVPPLILLIAWAIYDVLDDRIEASAGRLYDRAFRRDARADAAAPPIPPAPAAGYPGAAPSARSGAARRDDGLTDEQRRMLDDLGRG